MYKFLKHVIAIIEKSFSIFNESNLEKMQLFKIIISTVIFGSIAIGAVAAGYHLILKQQRGIDDENFFDAKSEDEELGEEKHQKQEEETEVRAYAPESGDTDTLMWSKHLHERKIFDQKIFRICIFSQRLKRRQ